MTRETRLEWLRPAEISADRTVRPQADPRRATPGLGKKHFEDTVDHLSTIILKELKTKS